jgi:hypothetical protein
VVLLAYLRPVLIRNSPTFYKTSEKDKDMVQSFPIKQRAHTLPTTSKFGARFRIESIGITLAAFEADKKFILSCFSKAMANGAFEVKSFDDTQDIELRVDTPNEPLDGKFSLTPSCGNLLTGEQGI